MWGVRLLDDALCDQGVTEFVVKFVLDKVCRNMKDAGQCENLAVTLVPVGLEYLRASIVPAQLCGSAGVCGKSLAGFEQYTKAHYKPKTGVMECEFCKFLVLKVKLALENPANEEQVKEEALKVCKTLTPELQDSCIAFVDQYEAAFFAFLDTMQPGEVCAMAGACMPQLVKNHPLPALSAHLATSLANVMNAPRAAGVVNDLCDTCKIVVLEAHQMVTNPKTQQQIEAFLEGLCSSFGTAKDECTALLEEYLPMLLDIAAEYLDPVQLCTQLGYCKAASAWQQLVGALRLRNLPLPQAKFHPLNQRVA